MSLKELQEAITQMVAMSADERRVGCEDGPTADDWLEGLQDAVSDGLDAAFDRAFAHEHLGDSQ